MEEVVTNAPIKHHKPFFFLLPLFGVVAALVFYFLPVKNFGSWGNITYKSSDTITVFGEAARKEKSQKAIFTAGVNATGDDKQKTLDEVNKKVEDIIAAVKTFGIPAGDIKTVGVSFNQNEESYWEDNRQKYRPGQWRVNNSVEVTLRNVDRASDLTNVLSKSGANNVWGPNFSLDEDQKGETEAGLLDKAVQNAREKADGVAKANGRKLGRAISITEGYSYNQSPIYFAAAEGKGGGGAPVEPGTQSVTKQVTVVFELQ